jgi:hypothetical protein
VTQADPPRWSDEQLEIDRTIAIARFREQRLQEPLEQYLDCFDRYRGAFENLLETTVDLTRLSRSTTIDILTNAELLEAVRYLAGPPVSEDDLKVLADATLTPSRLRADPDMAQRVIEAVLMALDRRRFPWVVDGRDPEPTERDAATLASAALLATQRLSTDRRSESKTLQEQTVADALTDFAFSEVPTRTITTLSDAPNAGEFCRESMLGGRKADFVIGLWDGRKMALECKVSNSSTNSVKRLNNDAAVKAVRWREEFGTAQLVSAAVLSGVFKLHNLKDAEAKGLTLFWAHNLQALVAWIDSTSP